MCLISEPAPKIEPIEVEADPLLGESRTVTTEAPSLEPIVSVDTSETMPAVDNFENSASFAEENESDESDHAETEANEEDDLTINLQKITASLDPQDPLETPGSCLDDITYLDDGGDEDGDEDPDDPSTSKSKKRKNKKHVCPQCDRRYSNKSTLNRHLREECGKKPQYTCRYCQKSFKQRSNFQRHIWTIHGCLLTSIA